MKDRYLVKNPETNDEEASEDNRLFNPNSYDFENSFEISLRRNLWACHPY